MAKLSIVMPAYNVEAYIAEAIDSVVNQTLLPHELIIVNDGSTDNTRQVISKYEFNPIVKVIDTENRGLGPARNAGLEASSSDYVYFFDSDDVMSDEFVEVISKVISDNNYPDMIVFSGDAFSDKGHEFEFIPPDYKRKIRGFFEEGIQMYRELMRNQSLFSSACLYVTKRTVWLDSGLRFKPIVHEDEEILLPLFFSVNTCCSIKEVLFHRRVRVGSIMTGGVTYRNVQGMVEVLRSLLAFKDKNPKKVNANRDLWRKRTQEMLVTTFNRSIKSGHFLPNLLMISVFFKVCSLKVFLQISRQYFEGLINLIKKLA